ncbi:histone-fold-containing protein [Bombardia bombarda]|uniref:Histone-fold-containing protein n=1 Tax=Bombardia bombarda TaxID=252184 RepID=A0AA40C8Q3_9PEZI|nr:histone-fold-containing protein [Bombardia bombarda]
MPYNTTAIPPRKEVTGQTQLPLTRVKKAIGLDPDIAICSNNAAFVITLATEMFIQHLTNEAQNMAKLERKPRRNIQYKDMANAVRTQDNLEFLEDVIPRTATYKEIKGQAAATRAKLKGEKTAAAAGEGPEGNESQRKMLPNGGGGSGKKQKSIINGFSRARAVLSEEDPNAQLEMEMRQAAEQSQNQTEDEDVDMAD